MSRVPSLVACAVLLAAAAGCESSRTPPVGPSPVPEASPPAPAPPPAPSTGVNVAGQVTDAAWRPLSGARIEVVNGPDAGKFIVTDGSGEYRLSGRFDESTQFRASRSGHSDVILPLPARCDRCNPQWWIYFLLESQAPHADLTGRYQLTFTAADSCTTLPDELRTRTYEATLTPFKSVYTSGDSHYTVTVSAPAVAGVNNFVIGIAGDYLSFTLGDLHGSAGLAEQLATKTYLGIGGEATAVVSTTEVSTISATLDGFVDVCELSAPPTDYMSCEWQGTAPKGRCQSRHRITLTRR